VKSREQIIEAIRRTASENSGAPVGQSRFETMTGIPRGAWRGKYWRVWSEALEEAGFAPNPVNEAHTREALVQRLAALTRQRGRYPTYTELLMAKRAEPDFPTHSAFQRLGSHPVRLELLRAYATAHAEYRDVLRVASPGGGRRDDGRRRAGRALDRYFVGDQRNLATKSRTPPIMRPTVPASTSPGLVNSP
jgi:hypothetical protein